MDAKGETMRMMRRNVQGFTITELLVVIIIIVILAALLLPVIQRSKDEAQRIACMNNLKQFGTAIDVYRAEYEGKFPAWLSSMLADQMGESINSYICPMDDSEGKEGSRPNWITAASQYAETNDMPESEMTDFDKVEAPTPTGEPCSSFNSYKTYAASVPKGSAERQTEDLRDSRIEACSYLYEFNQEFCTWGGGGGYLTDGSTWAENKIHEMNTFPDKRDRIPIVRCFFHVPSRGDGQLRDEDQQMPNVPAIRISGAVNMSWPQHWEND